MKQLVYIISGTSYAKGSVTKNGIRILRGGNIQNNNLYIYDDDVFLPISFSDKEKNIRKNDVVIVGSTGSKSAIGKPAFIEEDMPNTQIGAFLRIIRPIVDDYAQYLKLLLFSDYYRQHIRENVKGTNINNIKAEYIENLFVPLPPKVEQQRIVEKIETLFQRLK